jgi:hypothetical protein
MKQQWSIWLISIPFPLVLVVDEGFCKAVAQQEVGSLQGDGSERAR